MAVPMARPRDRATERRVVTAGHDEQDDVRAADHRVRAGEQEPQVAERLGNAQRHHQRRRHRGEDREADDALLGVDHARQPRIAHPRPPHHAEDQKALGQPLPGGVVGHQRRALGEGQHEDQIEEQLEGRDAIARAHDGCAPRSASGGRLHGGGVLPLGGAASVAGPDGRLRTGHGSPCGRQRELQLRHQAGLVGRGRTQRGLHRRDPGARDERDPGRRGAPTALAHGPLPARARGRSRPGRRGGRTCRAAR